MDLNAGWLETILSLNARNNQVAKVLSVETEDVVNKGDNYVSKMTRVKLEVILGSGRKKKMSIIMKTLPDTELRSKHIKQWGVFKKEILMFEYILPAMTTLMEETGESLEPMWPQCIEYRNYDRLVLEDLKELGYKMADKMKGLDLAHARLVVRSLAKFHAMSAILIEKGLIDVSDFHETIFTQQSNEVQQYHNSAFTTLADVIESTWEPEWVPYAEKLRALVDNSIKPMTDILERDNEKLNVLNHGDCWANNVMFKYILDSNEPASLRFVDFQLCYYSSYAVDLQYMITSSVQSKVKEEHLTELLEVYQKTLSDTLTKFGYSGTNIPTLEEVKQEFKRASFFGLVIGCTTMTFMLTDPEDVIDIEEFIKETEEKGTVPTNARPYMGKAFTERIKYILKSYYTFDAPSK